MALNQRIGVYYRVSTDKQDLDSQKSAIADWLGSRPMPAVITLETEDEGFSGRNPNRPGLNRLLKAVRSRKIDTVVVYKLDRLSRDAASAIRMVLDFDYYNCDFISVSQPALNLSHDAPFKRTMLAMFAELAQLEREMIADRVKAGLTAARKRGVVLGAPKKFTQDKIDQARQMRCGGRTYREIAAAVGLGTSTVAGLLGPKGGYRGDA